VVALLALGVVPHARAPGVAIVTGLCLAGLAGLIALSMLWGDDPGHAFEDLIRALFYLGAFVLVVICSRVGEARSWLGGLAAGLTGVALIALLARFEPSLFGNPDAEIAQKLPSALGRLSYPIGYWNGLAAAMAAATVLLVWFATDSASRIGRALAASAIPVALLACWMTESRGGLVAAAIGCAIMVFYAERRSQMVAVLGLGVVGAGVLIALVEGYDALLHDPVSAAAAGQGDRMLAFTVAGAALLGGARYLLDDPIERLRIPRRPALAVLGLVAVVGVIGFVRADPVKQFDEFKVAPTGAESGVLRVGSSGRYQFWTAAVDAFASAPLGGVGAAGYTPYWLQHREIDIPATRAHSLLLESMAELGIGGLALVLGFFGVAAVAGHRRVRATRAARDGAPALALVAIGLMASATDWTWDLPAVFGVTVAAAALLTGPATLDPAHPGAAGAGEVRTRRRFAGGVMVLLVAWIAICGSALLLLEDRKLQSSRSAVAAGDLAGALDAANDAADLEPWAAEPHTQLALIAEQQGNLDAARSEIAEAIDHSPRDYQLYLLAARIESEARDPSAGLASVDEALRLNPLDPTVQRFAAQARAAQAPQSSQ
jgi:O-Antigen ligase